MKLDLTLSHNSFKTNMVVQIVHSVLLRFKKTLLYMYPTPLHRMMETKQTIILLGRFQALTLLKCVYSIAGENLYLKQKILMVNGTEGTMIRKFEMVFMFGK